MRFFGKDLPRWLKQAAKRKDEKAGDGMNRASFRAAGLQGRRDSQLVVTKRRILPGIHEPATPQWQGRPRGGFFTSGRRPAILIPHASTTAYQEKWVRRMMGRVKSMTITEGGPDA